MQDKFFIDTNILIYSIIGNIDREKNIKSKQFISENHESIYISNQVINESINVFIKYKIGNSEIRDIVDSILESFECLTITYTTSQMALSLRERLNYSYYDLLIISSSIEGGCTKLISNDLQHDHQISDTLKIINPFI
jgi:predicted nucleic acid-binding protein